MMNKKPYSDRRWKEMGVGKDAGKVDTTEEERREIDAECEAFLKEMGVLGTEDKIEDFKIK